MDEDVMRDLARQFREHINYQGDAEQFDVRIIDLIRFVENECAKVVEQTPLQLFITSQPAGIIKLIATAVRGKV